jgi:hypothetical protein
MRRGFTPDEDEWLRNNLTGLTYTDMARHLGRDIVTIKRRLVLLDLADFDTPKLQPSQTSKTRMWNRPCLRCKSTELRPHNKYLCTNCSRRADELSSSLG